MWPFKSEKRQAVGGGYTEAVSTLIYAQAVGSAQNASATAAVESVAGMLSRTFASAEVLATPEIVRAVSPRCLGQIGRDLVRVGESLHVIRFMGGGLILIPASTWYWKAARTRQHGFARDGLRAFRSRSRGACRWNRSFIWLGDRQRRGHFTDWDRRPGLPTLQDYPRTSNTPWQMKLAGQSPNSCRSRKTAAATATMLTRWPP